ncbi:MAG: alpha/beta fold hydrolase [Paracoccaceae bacterium]
MTTPLIAARDAFAAEHPEAPIELNGRAWGVIEAGTGPALLLIPGTLGRADIFWQQIAALKDRLYIVAVSYPDSGGIEDWVRDLLELMDRRDAHRFAVLGSSLGGYLAQAIAAEAPERVRHLFAANTLASVEGLNTRPPYSSDLDETPIATLREGFLGGLRAWAEAHPDQIDLVTLLSQEVEGRIPEAELRCRLKALKHAPELPRSTLASSHVSVIEADDDPLIPPPMRDSVCARLEPATLFRFLWGGHFPYVVRPAAYTGLIEQAMGLDLTGEDWGAGALREA